jgi:hypothetical protein
MSKYLISGMSRQKRVINLAKQLNIYRVFHFFFSKFIIFQTVLESMPDCGLIGSLPGAGLELLVGMAD